MNTSDIILVVMGSLVSVFAIESLYSDFKPVIREFLREKRSLLTQSGDSSLGPQSVNWLGGTALAISLFICFVLN